VRIAAKKLEEVGLIKRVKRLKRSTLFFLNVPKLVELAKSVKEAETEDSVGGLDPFNTNPAQQTEADDSDNTDNTDGLEVDPANEPAPTTETMERLLRMVRIIWPEHPSHGNPHLLLRDLEECVRLAGGIQRCGDLFFYLQATDDEEWQRVADSRMLGRYLVKMVPIWLPTYAHKLAPPTEESEGAS
jgi:hypothetical protein